MYVELAGGTQESEAELKGAALILLLGAGKKEAVLKSPAAPLVKFQPISPDRDATPSPLPQVS